MTDTQSPKIPTRDHYRHWLPIQTRWMDNDLYGHVNNVVYYAYFDTIINRYLITEGGLDIHGGSVIGVCAESQCSYREGFAYPEAIEAGLAVGRLGNRSVTYEIGIFRETGERVAAYGRFVHVFVDRKSMKPVPIPDGIRMALDRLVTPDAD